MSLLDKLIAEGKTVQARHEKQALELATRLFPYVCVCGLSYMQDWHLAQHVYRMKHGLAWPHDEAILQLSHGIANDLVDNEK